MVTHFYHGILSTYLETYLSFISGRSYNYIGLVLKVNKNSKESTHLVYVEELIFFCLLNILMM